MIEYYISVLKNYAEFTGRARRSEYWYFMLTSFLISLVLSLSVFFWDANFIANIYSLAVFIPSIAVGVRRLHDTGRSGWNLLWIFLPLLGLIMIIIWFATDSVPGSNEYGPNPKQEGEEFQLYDN